MDFPDGQPVGKRERSIAEQHRTLVLFASIAILLPAGYVVGRVVSFPPLHLLATLSLSLSTTWALTRALRGRFIELLATADLVVRPTLRAPDRRTSLAVQKLSMHGFACVETVVVSTGEGQTLTRPIVVMQRPGDGQFAQAHSHGSSTVTVLDDRTWLITSTTAVVAHPTLRVQRAPKRQTTTMLELHNHELFALQHRGINPTNQPPALDVVIGIERMEQETVRALRAKGVVAPTARALEDAAN